VLLRPLPYADQDRLVSVSTFWRKTGVRGTVSAPDFHDYHDQATSFEDLAAYQRVETAVNTGSGADYAVVTRVTPEFFPLFRARAELGRLPIDAEQRDGGPLTAVVSHAFWATRLGGDRSALGRTLKYAERLYTIVGVLPAEFRYPAGTDVWAPWWVIAETTSRSAHNYRAVGRLKPGVTLERALSEMDTIARQLERAYPPPTTGRASVDRIWIRWSASARPDADLRRRPRRAVDHVRQRQQPAARSRDVAGREPESARRWARRVVRWCGSS
jgi:hypothetical protein